MHVTSPITNITFDICNCCCSVHPKKKTVSSYTGSFTAFSHSHYRRIPNPSLHVMQRELEFQGEVQILIKARTHFILRHIAVPILRLLVRCWHSSEQICDHSQHHITALHPTMQKLPSTGSSRNKEQTVKCNKNMSKVL